jgi:hypothetical protein
MQKKGWDVMRKKIGVYWSLVVISCFVGNNAHAQNQINDDSQTGGFFALIPDGTFDPSVDWTMWPMGAMVNGNSSNEISWVDEDYLTEVDPNFDITAYPGWANATTYITPGGNGYLSVTANTNTAVYVEKSVSRNSNDPTISYTGSGELRIFASSGSEIKNLNFGAALNSTTSGRVELWNGTYDGTRLDANAARGSAVYISNTTSLYVNGSSFVGPDNVNAWINNDGGSGLNLNNVALAVFDYQNNPNANKLTGGNGQENATAARTAGPSAGSALVVGGSTTILATNLFAEGGIAGSYRLAFTRDTADFNGSANGGDGIDATGTSNINIQNGTISGTDGGSLFLTGVSDNEDWGFDFTGNGGTAIDGETGSGVLENVTLTGGHAGEMTLNDPSSGTHAVQLSGGSAYDGSMGGGSIINGQLVAGNAAGGISFTAGNATMTLNGGAGLNNSSSVQGTISNTIVQAGNGGNATLTTTGSDLNSIVMNGGRALNGTLSVQSGTFIGGNAGSFALAGTNQTQITMRGGDAFQSAGTSVIENGSFYGGNGGVGAINNGSIDASGGDAIHQTAGTLTINGGLFRGGNGGVANIQNQSGSASTARAGLGAYIAANATLNGGIFESGFDGNFVGQQEDAYSQVAVWLDDADTVNIQGTAQLNGDLLVNDTTSLSLLGGTVNGNVHFTSGTTEVTISNTPTIRGSFILESGIVNTTLSAENDGRVLNSVQIQSGDFNVNSAFISAPNTQIKLDSTNATLNLSQEGTLSSGSQIAVNYGTLIATDLTLKENATLSVAHNGTTTGDITLSGNLDLSATGAKVVVQGIANTSSGTVDFLTANTVSNVDKIKVDLGWLTSAEVNTNTYQISYQYQPLNGFVTGISSNLNEEVRTNSTLFSQLNSLSEANGSKLIRFTETQSSDNADISMQTQQQVANVIAQRSNEVRGKSGFANTTNKLPLPKGVAGPSQENTQMQGWIRGYQASSSRDETSLFTGYDADTSGTVIGIDKRYGTLLIGLSAGTASSQIDGGTTYGSSIDFTQLGVYASIGSEKSYFDFAFTQADIDHDVNNRILSNVKESYSASLNSFYVGAGRSIQLSERIKITPEASLLISTYDQDAYQRSGVYAGDTKQIASYSADSQLLTLGATLSTKNQIDWFNRGLAIIPELRFHWLRELNPDLDDMRYTSSLGSSTLSLRSREENLFKMGVGLDFWSWHFYTTKFQLDYDLTTGESYQEHLVSGKVSLSF